MAGVSLDTSTLRCIPGAITANADAGKINSIRIDVVFLYYVGI